MKIGRTPTGPLNSLITRRSNTYTIYEESGGDQSWNGKSSLTSTGTSVSIDVHSQRTSSQQYPTGETFETSLRGVMTTDAYSTDVQSGNCIVHSGTVYEMTVDGWPDDGSPSIYILDLEERTDLVPP